MPTFNRTLLSGSTSGREIPVAATATPGTLVHTAVAGSVAFDEVYLWVSNVTATTATLTVQWGGVLDTGDHMVKSYSVPPFSAPIPIATGQVLNGGLIVRAFSDTANALNLSGFVNSIR